MTDDEVRSIVDKVCASCEYDNGSVEEAVRLTGRFITEKLMAKPVEPKAPPSDKDLAMVMAVHLRHQQERGETPSAIRAAQYALEQAVRERVYHVEKLYDQQIHEMRRCYIALMDGMIHRIDPSDGETLIVQLDGRTTNSEASKILEQCNSTAAEFRRRTGKRTKIVVTRHHVTVTKTNESKHGA